jgi:hypothetical protein
MSGGKTYLDPTDLVLDEIDDEAICYLASALLHTLEQGSFRCLEGCQSSGFETAAQHFQT